MPVKKKRLVIDAHAHFVPWESTDESNRSISRTLPEELIRRGSDIGQMIELMDRAGIDIAIINTASRSHFGAEVCKSINDGYARISRQYPGRFIPCAHIFPKETNASLAEMDRAITGLGLKGLALPTSLPGLTLDSPELLPVYEKVNRLEVSLVIHPTVREPLWGGEKYRISTHIAREYEIAKATCEVMYGVLPRFPELKFIMPHYGGGMPVLKGRVLTHHEPQGWPVPRELVNVGKSQRQLKQLGLSDDFDRSFDKLYFDTSGYCEWMPIMEACILSIKTNRICFGTDYPFLLTAPEDIRAFISNIEKLKISEGDKNLILGENMRDLFRL